VIRRFAPLIHGVVVGYRRTASPGGYMSARVAVVAAPRWTPPFRGALRAWCPGPSRAGAVCAPPPLPGAALCSAGRWSRLPSVTW